MINWRLPLVLTVEEAADRLGVGRTLMYSMVSSGAVESVGSGRLRRLLADALVTFLDELRRDVRAGARWRGAVKATGGRRSTKAATGVGMDASQLVTDQGRTDRRHLASTSKSKVVERVKALEQARDRGATRQSV